MKLLTIILVIVIVLVLFSFAAAGSCRYVPYSRDLMATNRYENFRSKTEYSTYPEHADADHMTQRMITPNNAACRKLHGFDGLYCSADQPAGPHEVFSDAQGSLDCQSFGYMNSRGYLCLNDMQKKLLTTRGGNATGGNMQVGGK
jgi:hypothetical protein